MQLSVIIPTYNRASILGKCLAALSLQEFPTDQAEILVIDDGSHDETANSVSEWKRTSPFHIRYFFQKNQGQGIARNLGVREAKGEIIIFIGDDIIVAPDFLKEHLRAHNKHSYDNDAVLGLIEWHPDLPVTPLMEFFTSGGVLFGKFGGHQFAFDLLRGKEKADYNFFYTSNISLKRSLLNEFSFDPWFSSYGWEDIELGYRLTKKRGLTLWYFPKALGYHYHPLTEEDFTKRMQAIGRSAVIFHEKYPELGKIPSGKKKFLLQVISNPISISLLNLLRRTNIPLFRNLAYYALSKKYFLDGIRIGYNERVR